MLIKTKIASLWTSIDDQFDKRHQIVFEMDFSKNTNLIANYTALLPLKCPQGSPLIREFSATWHLDLVFQNKRDLKCC